MISSYRLRTGPLLVSFLSLPFKEKANQRLSSGTGDSQLCFELAVEENRTVLKGRSWLLLHIRTGQDCAINNDRQDLHQRCCLPALQSSSQIDMVAPEPMCM